MEKSVHLKTKSTLTFDDAHDLAKLTTTVERQIELVPVPIPKQSPEKRGEKLR